MENIDYRQLLKELATDPVIEREVYVNHDDDSYSDVTVTRWPSGLCLAIRGECRFKFEGEIIIE